MSNFCFLLEVMIEQLFCGKWLELNNNSNNKNKKKSNKNKNKNLITKRQMKFGSQESKKKNNNKTLKFQIMINLALTKMLVMNLWLWSHGLGLLNNQLLNIIKAKGELPKFNFTQNMLMVTEQKIAETI